MIKTPKVVLIGRTNVGKSTLFNRLSSSTKAIVSDQPGTTRDRKEAAVTWRGRTFTLVDTGGLNIGSQQSLDLAIIKQAVLGLKQSDLVLFVLDSQQGLLPEDEKITAWLRRQRPKLMLVANKADNLRYRASADDFLELGLGLAWPVSAVNGSGSGDLLDQILDLVKAPLIKEKPSIKVAVVGRPNVGKSSLINALLNEERLIVSPEPHTTRDSQDIALLYNDQRLTLIDTAGLRRRATKAGRLESQSIEQTIDSLERADVALLVTEANQPLSFQDRQVADEIIKSGTSVIIIANKWDLLPDKTTDTPQAVTDYYRGYFPWLPWAPLFFMSALERTRLSQLLKLIIAIYQERFRFIDDNALNKFLKAAIKRFRPARGKGSRQPYIYNFRQDRTDPPHFILKIKYQTDLSSAYARYLENSLRRKFGFDGTPLSIYIEKVRI